ncbi:hypothetical protein BDW02DRAFT_9947 [Decorospora gaudefroyi]|uniref:Uncharacterized protein n=1 Tax=Decorospora gaudefroyi TaxID=184978 RepID=A0A6A5KY60_9PLEO|nr:hypothetical protein BDW02DRAFT_9947 [Decorospora gaudefroyi]
MSCLIRTHNSAADRGPGSHSQQPSRRHCAGLSGVNRFSVLGLLVVTQALARCCPKWHFRWPTYLKPWDPLQTTASFAPSLPLLYCPLSLSFLYKIHHCSYHFIDSAFAGGAAIKLSLENETWCSLPCIRRSLGAPRSPVRLHDDFGVLACHCRVRYPHNFWC